MFLCCIKWHIQSLIPCSDHGQACCGETDQHPLSCRRTTDHETDWEVQVKGQVYFSSRRCLLRGCIIQLILGTRITLSRDGRWEREGKRQSGKGEQRRRERGASAILATVPLATQSVWRGRRPVLLTRWRLSPSIPLHLLTRSQTESGWSLVITHSSSKSYMMATSIGQHIAGYRERPTKVSSRSTGNQGGASGRGCFIKTERETKGVRHAAPRDVWDRVLAYPSEHTASLPLWEAMVYL